MRWFWLFILGLVLVTGGLYLNRVRTRTATAAARPAVQEPTPSRPRRAVRPAKEQDAQPLADSHQDLEQIAEPEPVQNQQVSANEQSPEQIEEDAALETVLEAVLEEDHVDELRDEAVDDELVSDDPMTDIPVEPIAEAVPESGSDPSPELGDEPADVQGADSDLDLEVDLDQTIVKTDATESDSEDLSEPIETPTPESQEPPITDAKPSPSYEQLPDGTIQVIASGAIITGTGTSSNPFVVDWATLRSVERGYKPKAGKEELPDWLDVLDEKHIRITGNTLVPVIATTTRELLIMQNPWDGCCIGIPPSPYDAIEVMLNHDVDFGNSAVGYGTVEGVFILDPYVVDGWVLGLYIVEDATYRSGEGIAFPDF